MGDTDPRPLDRLPGFRRRILLRPSTGAIWAGLEDDYHRMSIVLWHDGERVQAIETDMERIPWSTCPGAPNMLRETFVGIRLADVAKRGMKRTNCTHLHDLTVLCAAHAADHGDTGYDLAVADPVEGRVRAEIRRDGRLVLAFEHERNTLLLPEAAAGLSLFELRDWIKTLAPEAAEAARLLQWGSILAHGRRFPLDAHAEVSRWPPNCYTFQPGRREQARHVGTFLDFSAGGRRPLSPGRDEESG